MGLEIYNTIKNLIGELPPELNFVYGICMIIFFVMLILCVLLPFYYIAKHY